VSTYNPQAVFYPGSQYCPTKIVNEWASYGQTNPCGTNALLTVTHNDTYGIQPRVTIIPPEIYGIDNTIKIGGLVAKETQPNGPSYEWGSPNVPQSQANEIPGDLGGSGGVGGSMRAIYQLYAQDKVDMLENTLHITPGLTLEGSYSEFDSSQEFGGTPSAATLASAYCQAGNPCLYGNYKATKWDREWLPFFNVDYDFDKILPAAKGLSAYASWGESALFAPVTDFTPNVIGGVPSASIVHMYEGGLKYDTSRLALGVDYFYQDVDRDFGFFQFQSGPNQGLSEYDNLGKREFKGVEGSAQYQLTPELQLFGNGSHLLAKYLESAEESVTVFQDQFGIGFKDTPNTGVPDWVANFGVDYDKHNLWHDGDLLNLRLAGEYTGHQYTTYDLTGTTNAGSVPGVPPFGTYTYYTFTAGATTYDPHGGISPFAIFNMDLTYTLPTPALAFTHSLKFDLNIQNLFDHEFYQYFYKQISPTSCGTFTSGPFKGQPISNYGCTAQFSDALPGEPFAVTFTVTAHF
jgi:iron complex outermembrane receptor protein